MAAVGSGESRCYRRAGGSIETGARLGRYEIVRLLGEGGAAEVYEAIQHGPAGFSKRVALKRFWRDGRKARAALVAEARLGAMVAHPNVVATLDLCETEQGWVIAMELVSGPSLRVLREAGPLSAPTLLDIATQLATALVHVHELQIEGQPAGLMHLDIKPDNVLITTTGLVKLADLGIATLLGSDTGGKVQGTYGFAPPEQLAGRPEARSDLFALGVTLVWLATGCLPFGGDASAMVRVQHPEESLDAALIAEVDAVLPGLGGLVGRCLRGPPADRPPSARALSAALKALWPTCPSGSTLTETLAERLPVPVDPGGGALSTFRPRAPTNLVIPATPLIGRTAEIAQLSQGLDVHRLVSVIGPAGVGKSRLVAEAANRSGSRFVGGVWRIELRGVETIEALCAVVGQTLGIQIPDLDPVPHLAAALSIRRPTLLVFDHVDGLAAELAPVLNAWIRPASGHRGWVVGRVRIEGLDPDLVLGPLPDDEATALFLARAPQVDPEATALPELVAALDGLPLAIELAAARTPFLPPDQILAGLQDRFRLLGAGSTTGGSLAAALELSLARLPPEARTALSQLTVFTGSFGLLDAEAILDPDPTGWALDRLTVLVDHSLVQFDPSRRRFRLLGAVRDYAQTLLDPDQLARLHLRHGEHYAQLYRLVDPLREGPVATDEADRLAAAHDELIAATDRAIDRSDRAIAARAGVAAAGAVLRIGPLRRGTDLLECVLALGLDPRDELAVRRALARLADRMGDSPRALQERDRILALAQAIGDPSLEAVARCLGIIVMSGGDVEGGRADLEAGWRLAAAGGHRLLEARSLGDLALALVQLEEYDQARAYLDQAIGLTRALGDRQGELPMANTLGLIERRTGGDSRVWFDRALALANELGDTSAQGRVLLNLATGQADAGRHQDAADSLRRSIDILRQRGEHQAWVIGCGNLGLLLTELGEVDEARTLLDEAVASAKAHGHEAAAAQALASLALIATRADRLDEALELLRRAHALEDEPQGPSVGKSLVVDLAALHRYRRELDTALELIDSILPAEGAGGRPEAWIERARILVGLRRHHEAMAAIHRAVGSLPEERSAQRAAALGVQAAVLLALGRRHEGRAVFDEAEGLARSLGLPGAGAVWRELNRVRGAFGAG